MKNKRMRQPCRMIVVYNKTHQTKKTNSFRYGQREKKKENDRPKMAARPRSINDRYEFVFFFGCPISNGCYVKQKKGYG